MNEPNLQDTEQPKGKRRGRVLGGLFFAVCLVVLVVSVWQLATIWVQREQGGREYDGLREAYAPGAASGAAPAAGEDALPADPLELNPDYVGWLQLPGTAVDYPVVRGADNAKYLSTTFQGASNPAGAIFMDYRNSGGFDEPHTIIYGHNIKNGSMFGGLAEFLQADYLEQHAELIITTPDGTSQSWRIFAVSDTDMWDPNYRLDFADDADFAAFAAGLGAPAGTTRLLTLSTCTNSSNDDERILLHAALI